MPVERPTRDDIRELAASFAFSFRDDEFDELHSLVIGSLAGYDAVEELYATHVAVDAPRRAHTAPEPDENLLGAWYVRTDVAPTGSGLLDGRRIAVKDNISLAGVPMMNGSRSVEGYVPTQDATVVSRVLAAGATIIGKSVCEDLCFSGSSFTSASGAVLNPWDLTRSAGGSSSGNAALIASGEVDLAIGGDQGGSVRIPASFCGIVGHMPTFGLVPYTGAFPIERTIDHLGPMANTVRDVATLLTVIAGADGLDSRQGEVIPPSDYLAELDAGVAGLRIGILEEGFGLDGLSDPEVDALVTAAAEQLAELGAMVTRVSVPEHIQAAAVWGVIATDGATNQMLNGNGYGYNVGGYYDPELMAHFAAGKVRHADAFSETIKVTALTGAWGIGALGGATYAKAQRLVPYLRAGFDRAFGSVDVLVLPTTPRTATPLLEEGDDRGQYLAKAMGMIANTSPTDVTGHPATSVPVGLVHGLPVGMMIIAPRFADALALRVAQAVHAQQGVLPRPATFAAAVD